MKKMGREREIPSVSGLSRRQCRKRNTFRKGMAYFLTFLMLMGNMQTISYAEGNAKEIAEQLGIEEKEKTETSFTEKSELNKDQKEENPGLKEEELSEKENVEVNNKNAEESAEDLSEDKSENKEELGEAEKKENEAESAEKESEKTGEEDGSQDIENEEKAKYLDADSFSAEAGDLTVTASFSGGTFFEGTHMKVELVKEEETVEEARKELEKEFKKEDPDADSEVEILETVDISFYREINGEVKEVQPKKGKQVEISIQKTEKIKEALSETEAKQEVSIEEEFKIVHLSEEHPTEILPVKEEGDNLLFAAKHFSVFSIGRSRRGKRDLGQAAEHELKAFWKEDPDPNAGTNRASTGHSYTDGSAGEMRKQTELSIIPPENNSNAVNTTTLGVELTLQGDKNTVYAPGTVNLYIPARIFKGWEDGHSDDENAKDYWAKNKITVSPDRVNYTYKVLPGVIHGIAPAPSTNAQSSFNYEIVKKTVNGKTEPYLHLKNYNELSGGVLFKADIGYNLTPSMLKVEDEVVAGKHKGVYDYKFPVTLNIGPEGAAVEKAKQDMSVHVETEVKETEVILKPGTADVNGGVYFNWDPTWGNPPAGDDPKDYFYAVWYVRVDRARGSSQPFNYKFELDPDFTAQDPAGGQLVGAKKMPMDYRKDYYLYNVGEENNIEVYAQNGYTGIAKNMDGTDPDPNGYLVNPIGEEQVGISRDPSVPKLPDHQPYVTGHSYAPVGKYNSQLYALVYRYPYSKMKDVTNLYTQGMKITNRIKFTETWADGYKREIIVNPKDDMVIYPRPGGGGKFHFDKYGVDHRQNHLDIFGLQTIFKDGTSAPLRFGDRKWSFTLSTEYTAKNENVRIDSSGNYNTTANNPTNSMGSGVTLTDGKYYLLSSKTKYPSTLNAKVVNGNPGNPDLEGLVNNTNTTDDVYRGDKYILSDDDYYYSSIYLDGMKVYDVEKVDTSASQGLVTFNQKSTMRDRNKNYPPVEVWLRKKGAEEEDFFKYGELYYDNLGVVRFKPAPGYEDNWTSTTDKTKPIDQNNQLSLVNKVDFGAPIVGLKLIQNSQYYRTAFDARYTMQITPTPAMQDTIAKTMERTDDYNTSFLAGAAIAEGRQYGDPTTKYRIGQYWPQVGYTLTPLIINSLMYKSSSNFEDHPEKSAQSMTVYIEGSNSGSLPTSLQGPEYTKKYLVTRGTIYDLLPAGTSVDPDSIVVSGWLGGWDLQHSSTLLEKGEGKDYTVKFEENWNGSGQTMMIIDFKIPEAKQSWSSYHNRSGWKAMYTLWNPYTNIVNLGRSVKNTLGYVNTDKNTVWNGNYISDERGKNPGVEKLAHYKTIKEKADKENPRSPISVIDRIMPFGPVTVLEAAFSNGVSTEIEPNYLADNVSYMGDSYKHRLLYQAQATTRTKDIVMFDILGNPEDRNGDFNGVDVSTMLTKRSYDKANANNQDTLKPVVYYATELPTTEQMDVSNPIWHIWNYEDESSNTGVNKKDVRALAFDLRKTKEGKDFILDQQGILIANVKMLASTDKAKVDPEVKVNTNTAYMYSTKFKGKDVPVSEGVDIQSSASRHRLVKPLIFDLPVRKSYEYKDSAAPSIQNWFTFTVEREDGVALLNEDGTVVEAQKNPDADGGLMVFEKIRLLKPGTYTLKIKEDGKDTAALSGVESQDMGDKFVTITVTDPDHKKLVSDLKYTKDKPITFKNIHVVGALDMELKVDKILSAAPGLRKPDIRNAFSFTLQRVKNAKYPIPPMPEGAGTKDSMTLTNPEKDGGEINFGPITITEKGVYEYIVTETGSFPGVVNDSKSERRIKISVREVRGQLFALVTGDELEFTNTFIPNPNEGRVELKKKVSGASPATPSLFRFTLRPETPGEGQAMPLGSLAESSTVEISGEGNTDFAPIPFTKPGVFNYTVEEINDGVAGYTYDPSVYTVSFTVTQSEDKVYELFADRKIYQNGVEVPEILFDNQYSSRNNGGGGGNPPKPIPVGPVTPGGPGEKPKDPEKPTVPDVPQNPENPNPDNGGNVPPAPSIPERIKEIEKRIGEILDASRKRPLTPEEKEELKRLGEVLGALRKEQSRKVNTSDQSRMIWYAFASAVSCICLAFYYLLDRKKRRR